MEIISIEVKTLPNILVLHPFPRHHFGTDIRRLFRQRRLRPFEPLPKLLRILFGKENLVDDHVMAVDAEFRQLLHEPLRLENGQELRDAHADEGRRLRIAEGGVDFSDDGPRLLQFSDHHVRDIFSVGSRGGTAHHGGGLVEEAAEAFFQDHDLSEGLLHDGGKREKTEGMTGRGRIEDDGVIIHSLHLLHELREGHGLVDAGNGAGEIGHEVADDPLSLVVLSRAFLHGPLEGVHVIVGVDFHAVQVVETVDEGRLAPEFLGEGVRQVVGGIGGDQQHLGSDLRKLYADAARGGRLADAALSSDEHPFQAVHFDYVPKGRLRKVGELIYLAHGAIIFYV
mmetsp:Transcript_6820/g.14707  ORF Transcript_6820/g.14707 Transcript_6820/m.14707 type:complete len:340 (+) Transcript_6820:154-1173(+)